MTIRWESIEVEGKAMRTYVGIPKHSGPLPRILIAQHGPGIDAQMQDVVHRLYREGYIAAAPELYYRRPDADPKTRVSQLCDEEIIVDLNETVSLINKLAPDSSGPLGIVGFCMGGRVSYLAATEMPELKAAVVFYGGGIMQARGNGPSPFERSSKIHCPIIAFSGAEDTNPSPEDMKKIDAELTRLGKWHEFHLYRNTNHAFQNFNEPRYNERSATGSWAEMLAFFDLQLLRTNK